MVVFIFDEKHTSTRRKQWFLMTKWGTCACKNDYIAHGKECVYCIESQGASIDAATGKCHCADPNHMFFNGETLFVSLYTYVN